MRQPGDARRQAARKCVNTWKLSTQSDCARSRLPLYFGECLDEPEASLELSNIHIHSMSVSDPISSVPPRSSRGTWHAFLELAIGGLTRPRRPVGRRSKATDRSWWQLSSRILLHCNYLALSLLIVMI